MTVRVLLFGVLTEGFGRREMSVPLAEGATVAELVSVLREDSSNQTSEGLWSKMAVAVNREYARREDVLREGDEVALLPPVSGGCCAVGCCAHGESLASLAESVSALAMLAGEIGDDQAETLR